ncbi:MAG TPA: NlpC/P60 family protein [Terriglobales bacterium]|nr:NlpC/P60 family protein [Terriglobales bacterium]
MTNEAWGAERLAADNQGEKRWTHPSSTEPSRARLLTAREGRALVDVALQQPTVSEKADCSHLVHQILNDAGLTYPYATSHEIFAGIPQFRRVHHVQPGDLIVWPGHVGLIVDPVRMTFFSFTSSGMRTDQYSSDYWRHRGYHRFYRYIVTTTTRVAAHRLTEEHAAKPSRQVEATAEVEASRPQKTVEMPEPSSPAAVSAEAPLDDSPVSSEDRDVPETIPVDSANGRPTKDDLEQAISELTNASAAALGAANRTAIPVVFVRSWKVEKIKLNGDEGWVELRIIASGERNPDGNSKKARVQKLRCDLRRDQTGWVLFPPRDRLYVSAQSR